MVGPEKISVVLPFWVVPTTQGSIQEKVLGVLHFWLVPRVSLISLVLRFWQIPKTQAPSQLLLGPCLNLLTMSFTKAKRRNDIDTGLCSDASRHDHGIRKELHGGIAIK